MTPAQPNHYNVCVDDPGYEDYICRYKHLRDDVGRLSVTFSSNHAGARPPNPKLLALHAASARVEHMSGAAKAFRELDRNAELFDELDCNAEASDESERDSEETSVFAFDGSSARTPDHSVTPIATILSVA